MPGKDVTPPSSPTDGGVPRLEAGQAQAMVEAGALLLDVREPVEWQQVRIPGATLIPMSQLVARLDEIPTDKPLVVQCRSGHRSHEVAAYLLDQGYPEVYNLSGGILAWQRQGLPVDEGR